jgi:hypothetical protein
MPICNICCVRIIWFGIIVDCIVIFSVSIFGKVPFTAVHSAEFTRGQREIEQLSELRSWTDLLLLRGMWSVLTLWWFLWN